MKIVDELSELEEYCWQLNRQGKAVVELYEQVQSCGNVLPRLYLLITAGSVYIRSKEAPAADILRDLVEMAKGVQHPLRGLFLRNYLIHMCKDKLPDVGSEYEGVGGTVQDAYEFVLQNFSEANRLWVRMQNQGPASEKKQREKAREELCVLVGTNLVRLSQLEGLDADEYAERVLPRLLENVVNCKDTLAQSYLMDCIIQVFPNSFHFATLEPMLETVTQLRNKVNVRSILELYMDRLSQSEGAGANQVLEDMFLQFNECVMKLLETKTTPQEGIRLLTSLLNFSSSLFPHRLDFLDHTLASTLLLIQRIVQEAEEAEEGGKAKKGAVSSKEWGDEVERMMCVVSEKCGLNVLFIENFAEMMTIMKWGRRRRITFELARAIITKRQTVEGLENASALLTLMKPLFQDNDEEEEDGEDEEGLGSVEEECVLVSRIIHSLQGAPIEYQVTVSKGDKDEDDEEDEEDEEDDDETTITKTRQDTDDLFRMLAGVRRLCGMGGVERLIHTVSPLVFKALALARDVYKLEVEKREKEEEEEEEEEEVELEYSSRKVFQFIHEILTAFASCCSSTNIPESFSQQQQQQEQLNPNVLAIQLFLNTSLLSDQCELSAITYEFLSQALVCYEEEVMNASVGARGQLNTLSLIVASLLNISSLTVDDYEVLATRVTQYSSKLLKKSEQCEMIVRCSHLFYRDDVVFDNEEEEEDEDEEEELDEDGNPKQKAVITYSSPRRVLECLQRALKLADVCVSSHHADLTSTSSGAPSPLSLFTVILEDYLYYYDNQHPLIAVRYISGLISLIREHLSNSSSSMGGNSEEGGNAVSNHFRNMMVHVRYKEEEEGDERYQDIL
jgi:vacuolar protein sorting-associated protein 35